ncbi:asparagine synthase C-terminal domain-containing protein [Candidatus Woesearchaeota archaeon]|nr:asparagine synthase C-terminal domain-containing protein [Candidatus Woesearchaeota archaeon]
MEEVFIKDNKLIGQKEWENYVDDIRREIEEEIKERKLTEGELKEQLKKDIITSIEKRTKDKFAVFFSGGIDSTLIALICKQLKKDFSCYCIGFRTGCMEEAKDLIVARQIAKELNLRFFEKEINLEEADKLVKKIVKVLPKPKVVDIQYVVNVGVAAVVLSSIELAQKQGKEKIFFSGLGSEEIFAGYLRHEEAKDVHEECWKGLKMMWNRDLVRDWSAAKSKRITIMTPFLDRDVIKTAMKIHVSRKINKEHKKIILREIAEELGLKHEFAWRKKLGAQYGSKSIKIIDQLARDNGFRLKKEYLANLLQKAI